MFILYYIFNYILFNVHNCIKILKDFFLSINRFFKLLRVLVKNMRNSKFIKLVNKIAFLIIIIILIVQGHPKIFKEKK